MISQTIMALVDCGVGGRRFTDRHRYGCARTYGVLRRSGGHSALPAGFLADEHSKGEFNRRSRG